MMHARRHARDYERLIQHAETLTTWAAVTLMTRRLARQRRHPQLSEETGAGQRLTAWMRYLVMRAILEKGYRTTYLPRPATPVCGSLSRRVPPQGRMKRR